MEFIMITLSQFTALLGWAAVLNIAYLLLATFIVTFTKSSIAFIHSKMFDLSIQQLDAKYFDYLSTYKILTLVLFVFPYFALKIMTM